MISSPWQLSHIARKVKESEFCFSWWLPQVHFSVRLTDFPVDEIFLLILLKEKCFLKCILLFMKCNHVSLTPFKRSQTCISNTSPERNRIELCVGLVLSLEFMHSILCLDKNTLRMCITPHVLRFKEGSKLPYNRTFQIHIWFTRFSQFDSS